jgi:O-antigen/teichoic acid export membrane protein
MAVAFVSVPLALNYLGPERYGLWMAAASLAFMLTSLAGGGIANGLITATANSYERKGEVAVRVIIASAAVMLIPVATGLILLAAVIVPLVPWGWIFSLSDSSLHREAAISVFLILAFSISGFVAEIVMKVRTGLQQIPAVSTWEGSAVLASLVMLVLAIRLELPMGWLIAAVVGTPLIVKAAGAVLFVYRRPAFRPRFSDIDRRCSYNLLGSGSVFFFIALTQAVAIQSDQVLIANMVGVDEVATYSVIQRLYTLPYILANFVFTAQWPAIAEASTRKNYIWVARTFRHTLIGTVAFAILLTVILLVMNDHILALWVGETIKPDTMLITGMGVYAVLMVIVGSCSTLLVSLDIRKPQIWLNLAMMAVNLPLSVFLISKLGAAGAIIGTSVAFLLCMIIPYAFIIPRMLAARSNAGIR